jgi:twitching motility protein PilT
MILDQFHHLLQDAITLHLSDVHIATDARPFIRNKSGDMEEVGAFPILSREQVELLAQELLSADRWMEFQKNQESDASYRFGEERFRVNVFQDIKGPAIVLRLIPSTIPRCEDIGIPEVITKLLAREKGLILVT